MRHRERSLARTGSSFLEEKAEPGRFAAGRRRPALRAAAHASVHAQAWETSLLSALPGDADDDGSRAPFADEQAPAVGVRTGILGLDRGPGLAVGAHEAAMTSGHRLRIESNSKGFTALVTGTLIEGGGG